MLNNKAFIHNTDRYDEWFDKNINAYQSELKAIRKLGINGKSIEIGAGTGKFAKPLGIKLGIEPTREMYLRAVDIGMDIAAGTAEELPLRSGHFDWVLMVTTICFVTDTGKSMAEMLRILKKGGKCAIALVDKDTELGRKYLAKKAESEFYKDAVFYSAGEVVSCMKKAGLSNIYAWQTLADPSLQDVEEPKQGFGTGGFAVICGEKN